MKKITLALIVLFTYGCARAPVKDRSHAMRPAAKLPVLADDLGFESLREGLRANIDYIRNSSRAPAEYVFGPAKIRKAQYVAALEALLERSRDIGSFHENTVRWFDYYEVYGNEEWGLIKATSYYAPVIEGSPKPTRELSQPLYFTPDDMLSIDIDAFAEAFPKWKIFKEQVMEQRSSRAVARARLTKDKKIVPYFDREEIDSKNAITDKEAVIAYVDPIKAFFLQIQGSGTVVMPDGRRFRVGYASQNGFPYVAIGSGLFDKIPKEKMSMQNIQAYLRTLSKKEMQKILNLNPSYVFFQKLSGKPITYLGTETVDGRTVATDQSLFPKGALAFLQFEKPEFESAESIDPSGWTQTSRYVLDQDTGGAIRGPGRLDLYAGEGAVAEQFSGVMKNPARLYYLVPKPEFVKNLP
jgi:membrane-bound lytic murein transglycosylase A